MWQAHQSMAVTGEQRAGVCWACVAMARSSGLLVNTSRPGLTDAVVQEAEITKGWIHAVLDVFDPEPLHDDTHPPRPHPNVLSTPYIGDVTDDAFDLQFNDIFDQTNALAPGVQIHVINPEVTI
ncbi:MAG: NAD(P)-dependent oxidoreductase [Aliishimia sp.]